ncbi:MAG TPA: hypothetical protein PLO65_01500 [Caulobacter sp.]|nr:hypothetical protein [Caulobacter sp.]
MRSAVLSLAALAAVVATPALAIDANVIDGVYTGGYRCAQGVTFLELTVDGDRDGSVRAVFRFNSATWNGGENRTVPEGKFAMAGRLNDQGQIVLQGSYWILQPRDYAMVNLAGLVTREGGSLVVAGNVGGAPSCTTFRVVRN